MTAPARSASTQHPAALPAGSVPGMAGDALPTSASDADSPDAGTRRALHSLLSDGATFLNPDTAAAKLGGGRAAAGQMLREMQRTACIQPVCSDGWVPLRNHPHGPRVPHLHSWIDDMMRHLDVGYYISYTAAAEIRGASHHMVLCQHVNVERSDFAGLGLHNTDGPADLSVAYHRIGPAHGRPVSTVRQLGLTLRGDLPSTRHRFDLRVATVETSLLDMVEHPERSGGMDNVATLAWKMIYWRLLDAKALADASDRYPAQVARRTGSLLDRVGSLWRRSRLGPLLRHARQRQLPAPVDLRTGQTESARGADRWGVTTARPLDPDL